MRVLIICLLYLSSLCAGQDNKLYWAQVTLASTSALDIAGSRGAYELNPLLGRGYFGARQTIISVGLTATAIGVSHLVVKKWPKSKRVVTYAVWGTAGVRGWAAYRVLRYR